MSAKILVGNEVIHQSPKAVLFDKDGTLIDIHHYWASMIHIRSERIVDKWFSAAFDKQMIKNRLVTGMGVDLVLNKIRSTGPVGVKSRKFIVDLVVNIIRSDGRMVSSDDIERLFVDVDVETSEDMLPLLRVLPGVEDILINLSRANIYSMIVSTDITVRARKAMQVLGLDGYFVEIFGGDLVENTKPASDIAELALNSVNCAAESAVVIGDHPVDILMGENAGIKVNVGVLTGLSDITTFKNLKCTLVSDLEKISVR